MRKESHTSTQPRQTYFRTCRQQSLAGKQRCAGAWRLAKTYLECSSLSTIVVRGNRRPAGGRPAAVRRAKTATPVSEW